jgi:hypothetical protein
VKKLAYDEFLKAGLPEFEALERAIDISYLVYSHCLNKTPPGM